MDSPSLFEERLAAGLARYADQVVEPFDADAIVEQAIGTSQRQRNRKLLLAPLIAVTVLLIAAIGFVLFNPPQPPPVPVPDAFTPTGSMAETRVWHRAILLADGRVLVIGGAEHPSASAELWDPSTESFGPAGEMGEYREGFAATHLTDGRVLITGGLAGDRLVSVEIWDPETESFTPAGEMTVGRAYHTATLLQDGRVLIVGGDGAGGTAELWDPATGSFTPVGSLQEARELHTATLLIDGRVLIVGGMAERSDGGSTSSAIAEIWEPAAGAFTRGNLENPPPLSTATVLSDGQVLIVESGLPGRRGADAWLWDPVTESTIRAGSLDEGRLFGHTTTLLPDGRVLVIGGEVHGRDTAQTATVAEIWHPGLRQFDGAGSLNAGRSGHTATLLPDGRILVVGGFQVLYPGDKDPASQPQRLTSAEVWDPSGASSSAPTLEPPPT
jgi:hypothetical protein